MINHWTLRWLALLILFGLSALAISTHADSVSTGWEAVQQAKSTEAVPSPKAVPSKQEVPPWQSHR